MELYIKTEWIEGQEKKQYQEHRDKPGPGNISRFTDREKL